MSAKDHWFIFQRGSLLLSNDHNPFPDFATLQSLQPYLLHQQFIGSFNGTTCFCAEIIETFELPTNYEVLSLRKAFERLDSAWFKAAVKAYSIINWDKNHQFCGRCGTETYQKPNTFERICPHCELVVYPRISPSMIVLIRKDEKILMARSPHFAPGAYGLIAGFVEPGESIEDAVHREVAEEVNIKITNLKYFGSQPWPFPDSLMIGFTADYLSGDLRIDKVEIEAADWYDADHLPWIPAPISIAGKLIQHFLSTRQK